MEADIPDRSRLSLLQLMQLVVFCAVGFACVAPMLHLWQAGVIQHREAWGLLIVALFEAIVVPLVWIGLSFILVRPGAWRDRVILALLLPPVCVGLGIASWILFTYNIPAYGNPLDPADKRVGILSIVANIIAILLLTAATLFLMLLLRRKLKTER
jgi:hypothetical protein